MALCTWLPWAIYGALGILLFGMFIHVAVHCRKCGAGWFAVSTGIGILALLELFHCGEIVPVALAGLGMAVFLGIGIALPLRNEDYYTRRVKSYFKEALKRDHALEDARQALLNEGWPAPVVEDAAQGFRKVSTPPAAREAERKVLKDIEYHLVQGISKGHTLEQAGQALLKAGWPRSLVEKQVMIQRGDLPSDEYSIGANPADVAPHSPRPGFRAKLPRPTIPVQEDQNPDDDPLPEPQGHKTPLGTTMVDPNWG
jgi:hypothetical protein